MKIKKSTQDKYKWYLNLCRNDEPRPLQLIPLASGGVTAIESFHCFESTGKQLPTKEPLLLEKYMQGKVWHGVTVENVSKSLVERLVLTSELNQYPTWVKNEIIQQASKLANLTIGYVPTFVKKGIPDL
jgi:hypothetical protein